MKPPDDLSRAMYHKYGYVSPIIIAEIQRDAREGMVPVEDVRPLTKAFLELLEELHGHEVVGQRSDGDIYWYNTGDTLINLTALRTKHPNLFKK